MLSSTVLTYVLEVALWQLQGILKAFQNLQGHLVGLVGKSQSTCSAASPARRLTQAARHWSGNTATVMELAQLALCGQARACDVSACAAFRHALAGDGVHASILEAWKVLLSRPNAVHVCLVEGYKVLLPGRCACTMAMKICEGTWIPRGQGSCVNNQTGPFGVNALCQGQESQSMQLSQQDRRDAPHSQGAASSQAPACCYPCTVLMHSCVGLGGW